VPNRGESTPFHLSLSSFFFFFLKPPRLGQDGSLRDCGGLVILTLTWVPPRITTCRDLNCALQGSFFRKTLPHRRCSHFLPLKLVVSKHNLGINCLNHFAIRPTPWETPFIRSVVFLLGLFLSYP